MDLLDRLIARDLWATPQLLGLGIGLGDSRLDQEFDPGHRTLRETFHHMIYTIGFWTATMSGRPAPRELRDLSIPSLLNSYRQEQEAFSVFAQRVWDEARFDDVFIDHYEVKKSMGGTLLAILLHNEEHRTEALHVLNRLDVPEIPEIDLGAWDCFQQNPEEQIQ